MVGCPRHSSFLGTSAVLQRNGDISFRHTGDSPLRAVVLRSDVRFWRARKSDGSFVCYTLCCTMAVHCVRSALQWDDTSARRKSRAAANLQWWVQVVQCCMWTAEVGVLFMLCYWQFTVPTPLNFILCSAVRLWLFAFVPLVILLRVWLQFSVGFPVPTWLTVKFRCDNELLSLDYAFHK